MFLIIIVGFFETGIEIITRFPVYEFFGFGVVVIDEHNFVFGIRFGAPINIEFFAGDFF